MAGIKKEEKKSSLSLVLQIYFCFNEWSTTLQKVL